MCIKVVIWGGHFGSRWGWKIIDRVQGRFCRECVKNSCKCCQRGGCKRVWNIMQERENILSSVAEYRARVKQSGNGRGDQWDSVTDCRWTAEGGELGRETEGRNGQSWTGLHM
jgi:hypothetical protein